MQNYFLLFIFGEVLNFYTDNGYVNAWDYTIDGPETLYGQWTGHNHEYNVLNVVGNAIVQMCDCGYSNGKLEINANANLEYNGEGKPVNLINTMGVADAEYTLAYKYQFKNTWLSVNEPIRVGKYKAILTYKTKAVEIEFEIKEQAVVPDVDDNSPTEEESLNEKISILWCAVSGVAGIAITSLLWIIVEIIKKKKSL